MTNMLKKVFNWSEVRLSEMTCYKIHTYFRWTLVMAGLKNWQQKQTQEIQESPFYHAATSSIVYPAEMTQRRIINVSLTVSRNLIRIAADFKMSQAPFCIDGSKSHLDYRIFQSFYFILSIRFKSGTSAITPCNVFLHYNHILVVMVKNQYCN